MFNRSDRKFWIKRKGSANARLTVANENVFRAQLIKARLIETTVAFEKHPG